MAAQLDLATCQIPDKLVNLLYRSYAKQVAMALLR